MNIILTIGKHGAPYTCNLIKLCPDPKAPLGHMFLLVSHPNNDITTYHIAPSTQFTIQHI